MPDPTYKSQYIDFKLLAYKVLFGLPFFHFNFIPKMGIVRPISEIT
jgi:hypothetical protein